MRLVLLFLFLFSSPPIWAMAKLSASFAVRTPLVGKPLPDIVLPNTKGVSSSVMAARQGGKAILVFWATWCPHCYEDLGSLYDNLAAIKKQGIKIILVDVGETKKQVSDYFKRRKMKLTSFVDANSVVLDKYFLIGVPTLLFIDEKGIVRSVTHVFPSDYESYFGNY
ncbi:MAG: TlpA family protein disulfide reductase [Candidatus Omnitrophica bacterium]|nr:TlpA family protein disulfide reductase [Candidatus Omnitrophota bacterium]